MSHSHDNVDCMAVLRQFWDYLDAELPAEGMAAMQRHLERCAKCGNYVEHQRAFLAALSAARQGAAAPPALRARVYRCLREAGFSGGGRKDGER